MQNDTYLIFIVVVYEVKDPIGNFTNSTKVELFDTNRESAERRALELAGTDVRCHAHTTTVLERFKGDVSA